MHEYRTIDVDLYKSPQTAVESWSRDGWRPITFIPPNFILLERELSDNPNGKVKEGTVRYLIDALGQIPPARWDDPWEIVVIQDTFYHHIYMKIGDMRIELSKTVLSR